MSPDCSFEYIPRLHISLYSLPGINIAQCGQAVSVNFTKQRHLRVSLLNRERVISALSPSLQPFPRSILNVSSLQAIAFQFLSPFGEGLLHLLLAPPLAASLNQAEASIWPAEFCVSRSVVSLLWLPSKGPLSPCPPPRPGCGTRRQGRKFPVTALHSAAPWN